MSDNRAFCRPQRCVVHPRRLDRRIRALGTERAASRVRVPGYPSGLPSVRASRRCLSSSVKYVRRRSFGVTWSTPACSAMVRTRTITACAVMSRGWMRPPLATSARSAPGRSPPARDPGVDNRFLATVCRVDLPLVVGNGDRTGHPGRSPRAGARLLRALKAGAVEQSEHGYITGADRIGTRCHEQPPKLAPFDVSSCTPAPLRPLVRLVLDSDPRLVVYQPKFPCYAHRTPDPRKQVVDGARCGVAVDHIRTQPFDLSPAYLRPVERRRICDSLVSEDCDRAVECPARRRPACRPSQPAPRDPQGPRHPTPTRGTPRAPPARGHSAPLTHRPFWDSWRN